MAAQPVNPPTHASALPAIGRVVVINTDGSLDVRHELTRKSWHSVTDRPKSWTPAVGDRVLMLHVSAHPQKPVIVQVLK